MNNGIILSLIFLIILLFLGIILTSITSMLFVAVFFTPKSVLKEIVEKISPQDGDEVVDLGSGDGRILLSLSDQSKIKGVGFDISPIMVLFSKFRKTFSKYYNRDIKYDVISLFDVKYNQYDIIYCNLSPTILEILGEKFKKTLKGTRVFSYKYEIPKKKAFRKYTLSNGDTLVEYHY